MNKQKLQAPEILRIAFIALFLLLCLLPSLGMLLFGESEASANEVLAQKPVLVKADGSINRAALNDFSDYMADRFAFRRELANAWATLNARLLHSSVEDQVVLGSDAWLYYMPTLDDYMGRSMSEAELKQAAQNLASLQNEAESRGARFLFTIAPNKNSLYGEHMPSYIPAGHENANAVRLKPYLEAYGVHYLDLFTIFSKNGEILYYRGDSHWTDRGAALAADALLTALGKQESFFAGPFTASEPHRGDLYEMLFPTGEERESAEQYAAGFSYSLAGDARGGNALKIVSTCEGREGKLICWRDSFGISLYPYLAESFSKAVFLRAANYDMSIIENTGADAVLIEIVERNLPALAALELPQEQTS